MISTVHQQLEFNRLCFLKDCFCNLWPKYQDSSAFRLFKPNLRVHFTTKIMPFFLNYLNFLSLNLKTKTI